jgi:hypothetical protein
MMVYRLSICSEIYLETLDSNSFCRFEQRNRFLNRSTIQRFNNMRRIIFDFSVIFYNTLEVKLIIDFKQPQTHKHTHTQIHFENVFFV